MNDEKNNILKEIIETEKFIIKEIIRVDADTKTDIENIVTTLQQEIAELRAIIEELKNNSTNYPTSPDSNGVIDAGGGIKYIVANAYRDSEMNSLIQATNDSDVIGIIITPTIYTVGKEYRIDFMTDSVNGTYKEFTFGGYEEIQKIDSFKVVKYNIKSSKLNIDIDATSNLIDNAATFDYPMYGTIDSEIGQKLINAYKEDINFKAECHLILQLYIKYPNTDMSTLKCVVLDYVTDLIKI